MDTTTIKAIAFDRVREYIQSRVETYTESLTIASAFGGETKSYQTGLEEFNAILNLMDKLEEL